MTQISGINPYGNIRLENKEIVENKSNKEISKPDMSVRLRNDLIALAMLGAATLGLSSCSNDELLSELSKPQETEYVSPGVVVNDKMENMATPVQRYGFVANSLGIESPMDYMVAVNKETKADGAYDEVYESIRSNNADTLRLDGIVVHRNTGNDDTESRGVKFQQKITNGANGGITIKKLYLENDKANGIEKGSVETKTISQNEDGTFSEIKKDSNGNITKATLYKDADSGIAYRKFEDGSEESIESHSHVTGNQFPVGMSFNVTVDEYI